MVRGIARTLAATIKIGGEDEKINDSFITCFVVFQKKMKKQIGFLQN